MQNNTLRLAKTAGWFTIMASALASEYGSGINVVAESSMSVYPGIGNLAPLAMFTVGLFLIPKVFMFQRYGSVASSSGGEYTWISRSISPAVGFITHFIYWIGVISGISFLAYATGTTLASTLVLLGITSGAYFATIPGHIFIGLSIIILIFGIHYSGIRSYSYLLWITFVIIVIAAAISMIFGFGNTPSTFESALLSNIFHGTVPSYKLPKLTYFSFFGTMTLFVFAYGGLSAAPMLGGETKNPKKNMPLGIILGWGMALVLFTLVTLAIFHVANSSLVYSLLKSNKPYYTTLPGIISLIAPKIIGLIISVLITIILAKTISPAMLASSRSVYAWANDGILPSIFLHVNNRKAPDTALLLTLMLSSIFLIYTSFIGIAVIVIRSVGILIVIMVLGFGVLILKRRQNKEEWQKRVTTSAMVIMAILGIAISLVLIPSVIYEPGISLFLQPSIQLFITFLVGIFIFAYRKNYLKRKENRDISEEIRANLPSE